MSAEAKGGAVKCVVWDLDNTLWRGVLLEGDDVALMPGVRRVLEGLDRRGILHSIASKNDERAALAKLAALGVDHFFLHPQISWGPKSSAVAAVARALNIGTDALAFVDDQPFERDEVSFSHPEVLCLDAAEAAGLLERPELTPRFVTEDAARRREMYRADASRQAAEDDFAGPKEAFLATLGMELEIAEARAEDLRRVEELTRRTHQLNTTGYTYSYEELEALRASPRHKLFVAGLVDRYGTYGKIGFALLECDDRLWNIKLLLMSCRVASRGVGAALLGHIRNLAREAGVELGAEFVANDRNRMMYVTYKFNGFREVERRGPVAFLRNDLSGPALFPPYLTVRVGGGGP